MKEGFYLLFFLCYSCGNFAGDCVNNVYSQISSPDKKHKVVLFERDCGATTHNTVNISIMNENKALHPDSNANIFNAYGFCKNAKITWKNDREVLIEAAVDTSRIFNRLEKWGDIYIEYNVISE